MPEPRARKRPRLAPQAAADIDPGGEGQQPLPMAPAQLPAAVLPQQLQALQPAGNAAIAGLLAPAEDVEDVAAAPGPADGLLDEDDQAERGTYAYREREQERLEAKFEEPIRGQRTHEMEHVIGASSLMSEPSAAKKRKPNRNQGVGQEIAARAPAYQEEHAWHRSHVGTGWRGLKSRPRNGPDEAANVQAAQAAEERIAADQQADANWRLHRATGIESRNESGMTSLTYREAQRALLESGPEGVSAAVQLNQLGYAHTSIKGEQDQPVPFRSRDRETPQAQAANDSYHFMVEHMGDVPYLDGGDERTASVDEIDRAEMHVARIIADTGKVPPTWGPREGQEPWGDAEMGRADALLADAPAAVRLRVGLPAQPAVAAELEAPMNIPDPEAGGRDEEKENGP